MNFDFSEEQKLLQKTARDFLAEHCPLSVVRGVFESDAPHSEPLWKRVAEMGWLGVAIPEAYGGAGYGQLELALIAQELGRVIAPIPFSSTAYLLSEALLTAGSAEQKERYLPRVASGECVGAFAWTERPGALCPDRIETRLRSGRLNGVKVPVLDAVASGLALVVVKTERNVGLALVDLEAEGVEISPVTSFDPSRPQARLTFRDAPAELLGDDGGDWSLVEHVLDRAAVLMAFEQVGGAEQVLESTREFCLGRYAFGRPIASFQALKHRLVDLYAAIQLATSNAYYGAWALQSGAGELATAACSARFSASEAFDLAVTEMLQMYGGVGFTWEYDCHLFYRRAKLLGLTLGGSGLWGDRLVERMED